MRVYDLKPRVLTWWPGVERRGPVAGGWTTAIRESSAIVLNFGASVLTCTPSI